MEEEIEDIASTTDEEEVVEETVDETEETTLTVEDYNKSQQKNKELYERAKKAEALVKELKSKPVETFKKTNETPTGLTREEAILIAKGVNEDVINQAAFVAKARGIDIMEAMNDPLIEALSEKIKATEKKEKAQLSASKGSGNYTNKSDLSQVVGMTEEEHRKLIGM